MIKHQQDHSPIKELTGLPYTLKEQVLEHIHAFLVANMTEEDVSCPG